MYQPVLTKLIFTFALCNKITWFLMGVGEGHGDGPTEPDLRLLGGGTGNGGASPLGGSGGRIG